MSSMLDPILEATRHRIGTLPPLAELVARAADQPPARDFTGALGGPSLSVIAEIKRRSPSAGDIATDLDPTTQAKRYEAGGAAAISVLTEPRFFNGSLDDLDSVRSSVDLPVLRKDFTLDARQVYEARCHGADAVLLIVAALTTSRLDELLATASAAGCAALVEVHNAAELETAMSLDAEIIGVNNRNLTTFHTDLVVAETLAPTATLAAVSIAESGVSTVEGARRMRRAGYDAILVGEALVRSPDPARLIAELTAGDG